jgi:thiopurine S-methyltransferase
MDHEFWRDRWREGKIGFHEGRPNAMLARHVARLGERRRALVPLCGKAHDLALLASLGHEVVGVELVEDAVRAFFDEHGLTPTVQPDGPVVRYAAGRVTLLAGDLFAVTPAQVGPVDALYDRAAVIALPEALRTRYAAHLRALLAPGSPALVVTFEYPQELMGGPPFSVPEAELRRLYPGQPLELLDERPDDRLRDRGAEAVERCWALRF